MPTANSHLVVIGGTSGLGLEIAKAAHASGINVTIGGRGVHPGHAAGLVLAGEEIQVCRKVLQERRKLETLPQPLFADFVVPHPGRNSRHKDLRLDAMVANDRDRNPLALLEDG